MSSAERTGRGPAERPLTFDPCFGKLGREIARFANHTRKLVRASQKYRSVLEDASRASEGVAPLTHAPENPSSAIASIDRFALSRKEDRISLVGAYFAHHHLRNQAELSRELLRESFDSSPGHRVATCHRIYARAQEQRRLWISALLERTIEAAAPDLRREDYAAFNVGSLTDHEDVDLAIAVASVNARTALARGFARVSKTFLRFASKIQLFLTEQFSTPRTSALLEEYEQILANPSRRVVSATQLLGAQHIAGTWRLARALEERVTSRFYAGQGRPIVHEGYLRSVMAELRHHLTPSTFPGMLSPKREIYVPAKLATAALRVIHGVREPRPPEALALLSERDPANADIYRTLADAFAQNEVLRSLMFLYVVQGDDFDLSDPTIRLASRRVAVLLGLGQSARRSAEGRLMGFYADVRAQALRSVASLSLAIARHLGRVSTFRNLIEQRRELRTAGENVVLTLLDALESHAGSVFWDEVVELVGANRDMSKRFVQGFAALSPTEQQHVARRYVELMCDDVASLIEFLGVLATEERERTGVLPLSRSSSSRKFWRAIMRKLAEDRRALDHFIHQLDTESKSEALFRLASAYPARSLSALADLIERADDVLASTRVARTIRSVTILVHHSSNALGRLSTRVLSRTPEFLLRLGDTRRLRDLGNEIVAEAAREPVPRKQIELLGDAFDVSSLRGALIAILEADPSARDAEFTEAVDQYVRELFKSCFREVRDRSPILALYRPGVGSALYATGGYGRREAFGADWDYMVVVRTDDGALKKFLGKVLERVSRAMVRRGLIPHNRLSAHFNSYVVSIPELQAYFAARTSETFIDEAEILEARFLFGDPAIDREFKQQIWSLVATSNRRAFIRDVLRELDDRRLRPPLDLNIKLGPGGLREIHLLSLAIRAEIGTIEPLVNGWPPGTDEMLPQHRDDLTKLALAQEELRRARDLYRLVVAADDSMQPELLVQAARHLVPLRRAGIRGKYGAALEELMGSVAVTVDRVVETLLSGACTA